MNPKPVGVSLRLTHKQNIALRKAGRTYGSISWFVKNAVLTRLVALKYLTIDEAMEGR